MTYQKLNTIFIFAILFVLAMLTGCESADSQSDKGVDKHLLELNISNQQSLRLPFTVEAMSSESWPALEGELGFIEAFDNKGNELGLAFLTTQEDWMRGNPVKFTAVLDFMLEQDTKGELVFTQNSANDEVEVLKFSVPVNFLAQ